MPTCTLCNEHTSVAAPEIVNGPLGPTCQICGFATADPDSGSTGLSGPFPALGQTFPPASDLPMGGHKFTGMGDAVNPQDSLNLETADARYVGTTPIETGSTGDVFLVRSDGTVHRYAPIAISVKVWGARGDGVMEVATPFQSAYDAAAATGGTMYVPPGTYYVSDPSALSVISVAPRNAGTEPKVRIMLSPGATIKLSTNTPRFTSFVRAADDDLFHDFEIDGHGATINANSVGGHHHVIAGTFGAGLSPQRLNFKRITIRNLHGINAPTDQTGVIHRLWIDIHPSQSAEGQAQNTVEDVTCEKLRLEGGNQGIGVLAAGSAKANVYFDRIALRDCYHDTLVTPTAAAGAQANFQVGSAGIGGSVSVVRCIGKNSADVGLELDGLTRAYVEDCYMEDCSVPYYATNFNNPVTPLAQRFVYHKCVSRKVLLQLGPTLEFGFRVESQTVDSVVIPAPPIVWDTCTVIRSTAQQLGNGEAFYGLGSLQNITMRKCRAVADSMSIAGSNPAYGAQILINNTGPEMVFDAECDLQCAGSYVSGSPAIRLVQLGGNIRLKGHFRLAANITGYAAQFFVGVNVGYAAGTINGTLRVDVLNLTGITFAQQVLIAGTGTLTISRRLDIHDSVFLPQFSDVGFADATNQPFVYFRNNRWSTYPKPSAAVSTSNFATATFTTGVGNRYIGGDAAEIHFANGTGAGITAIAVSKDGTTYENAYTQASGAMANSLLVPVDNGDYVKITFATTAPTVRVRPRK